MMVKEAILLTNIWKSHVAYIQAPMNGCIAEVVILCGDDIGFHFASVILNPELKLGCVEGNLQMKVLTKFNVNQLLLWNSLCGFERKHFIQLCA